jgi:uncharacterized protein YndB with AHSA1/START domain
MNDPLADYQLLIENQVDIDAPPPIVFQSILDEITSIPDAAGKPMNFKLEAKPGGRWYRDLGDNAGHLWGHVQVIKPPTLLEITGPLMMSMAVVNHVTYRITPSGDGSKLAFTHRGFGQIDPKIREGVTGGWKKITDSIKSRAQAARQSR